MTHKGAIGHRRPAVFSKALHSPLNDTLGFDACFLIVYHEKVVELHGAYIDPLSTFFAVPGGERTEDSGLGDRGLAPSVLHGEKILEDPQSKPALRVHSVVIKLTKGNSLLADVWVVGRAIRAVMHAVPEAKMRSPCSGIVANDVIGICDPVAGGSDVII